VDELGFEPVRRVVLVVARGEVFFELGSCGASMAVLAGSLGEKYAFGECEAVFCDRRSSYPDVGSGCLGHREQQMLDSRRVCLRVNEGRCLMMGLG
jgi:hypothetical protein